MVSVESLPVCLGKRKNWRLLSESLREASGFASRKLTEVCHAE